MATKNIPSTNIPYETKANLMPFTLPSDFSSFQTLSHFCVCGSNRSSSVAADCHNFSNHAIRKLCTAWKGCNFNTDSLTICTGKGKGNAYLSCIIRQEFWETGIFCFQRANRISESGNITEKGENITSFLDIRKICKICLPKCGKWRFLDSL